MSKLFSKIHKKRILLNCGLYLFILLLILGINIINDYKEVIASAKDIQEGIASDIIRFHVIANSDTKEDQELKIKVKDAVVMYMKEVLKNVKSQEDARRLIINNSIVIQRLSSNVIKQNGYEYKTVVSLEDVYFPAKVYGDMTFPPGYYEALRIQIGKAKGKNWWCVMFPPLCFVDATYNIVPERSQDTLKYLLTEQEYDSLLRDKKTKVKVKFKLLESLKQKIY